MGKRIAALIVAVSTVVLAGCTIDGTAQRAPLDIDLGSYKTAKTDAETSSAAWMAGAELGAYLPFPSEIDSRMIRVSYGTSPLSSVKNLGAHVDGAESVPENKKFQFGFAASGNDSDPNVNSSPNTRSLKLGVFRYSDEDAARAAIAPTAEANRAEVMATRKRLNLSESDPRVEPAGTDFPAGSVTISRNTDDGVSMKLLVPRGNDVLLVDSFGRSTKETAATVRRAVRLMTERLKGSEEVSEKTSLRNAEFVTLTVPFSKDGSRGMFEGTATGPRSYAHIYHDAQRAYRAFTDADVDLIAMRETVLFRTGAVNKAAGLRKAYGSWEREDDGVRTAGDPRDLPSAACTQSVDSSGTKSYSCDIVVDRYYARASSSKSLLDAQQKISAQYLILKERG